jgi:hypothetical protein
VDLGRLRAQGVPIPAEKVASFAAEKVAVAVGAGAVQAAAPAVLADLPAAALAAARCALQVHNPARNTRSYRGAHERSVLLIGCKMMLNQCGALQEARAASTPSAALARAERRRAVRARGWSACCSGGG